MSRIGEFKKFIYYVNFQGISDYLALPNFQQFFSSIKKPDAFNIGVNTLGVFKLHRVCPK